MVKLLWLFVLFSFQHGISYDVNYVHCDIDEIAVRYEEEVVDVELFNIEIKEKAGWKKTWRFQHYIERFGKRCIG